MRGVGDPLDALLDLIDFGIILIDGDGAVVAVNEVAREISGSWSLLAFAQKDPGACATLCHKAVIEAAGKACAVGSAAPHAVAEIVLHEPKSKASLLVTVVNLPASTKAGYDALSSGCALFFRDAARRSTVRSSALLKQFGFTPAEMELALAMLEGLTLDECCGRLGLSKHTLRSRMKAMLTKTGVHRQGQLLALILKNSPQIRIGEPVRLRKR